MKIRQSDFSTFTRQKALRPPGNGTDQIYAICCDLLATWLEDNPGSRIRLLGVGGANLAPADQGDLFADTSTAAVPLDQTVDRIRDRFGNASVGRASTLDRPDPDRPE